MKGRKGVLRPGRPHPWERRSEARMLLPWKGRSGPMNNASVRGWPPSGFHLLLRGCNSTSTAPRQKQRPTVPGFHPLFGRQAGQDNRLAMVPKGGSESFGNTLHRF